MPPDAIDTAGMDAVFICAEHRRGARAVSELREGGFDGLVIDLSADHRLSAGEYARVYGSPHPAPSQIDRAVYGLTELNTGAIAAANLVANPGCFATGITLALAPVANALGEFDAHVTALTGASGSGALASAATHFPTRDGNVRAYSPLVHRHLAEVRASLGAGARVHFVPASGPWTRGIWGSAHVELPAGVATDDVGDWFDAAYADAPAVRLSPGVLPEMLHAVGTPYCDLGWVIEGTHLVVGFALDNLLKGAASQAVQNMNLALGLPEMSGLVPQHAESVTTP
jgi:N-acetyl-gamma-glutamyl-phosphate reductase